MFLALVETHGLPAPRTNATVRGALRAVGYQVLEYTYRQLRDDAEIVAAELRALVGGA